MEPTIPRRGDPLAQVPAARYTRPHDDRGSQRALVVASLLRCPERDPKTPPQG